MSEQQQPHRDPGLQPLRQSTLDSDTSITLRLQAVQVTVTEEMLAEFAALLAPHLPVTRPPEPSPYLTVPEAAAYLRSSRQRVYDLISSRRLPRHKDGSRVLIRRADLDAYLNQPPQGA